MISPMTSALAKIVCIEEPTMSQNSCLSAAIIKKGEIYTVFEIFEDDDYFNKFAVELVEHSDYGYGIELFRRLITPEDFAVKAHKKELENVD